MAQPRTSRSSNRKKVAALVAATFAISSVVAFAGCTFSTENLEFERAEKAELAGKHDEAVKHYRAVIDRSMQSPLALKAAQEAARISNYDLKRYKEAILLYKHVVLYSPTERERIDAQKHIAEINFSQILDYTSAIVEYSRLLELPHGDAEEAQYRMAIARSYFYQNNFFQSQAEIDRILKGKFDKNTLFDARVLKANIFLTTKELDDAIKTLNELIRQDPERAKEEKVGLLLAICYEEQKNFSKAVETLVSIRDFYPRRDFIDNKIRALKEREYHQPGARGLKK
ncbi:MAG: tetratricopeptide repeat protein [Bdellovibrionota bacterium]